MEIGSEHLRCHRVPKAAQYRSSLSCIGNIHASLAILGLLLMAAALGCSNKETQAAAPPPEVEVTDVVQQDVPIYGEWFAILDGYVNAQI